MKNVRQIWLRVAAVSALAVIAAVAAAHFLIGPRYNGHSADYWLRQTLSTNASERIGALQALQQTGPAADTALIRGLEQKQSIFCRFISGMRWSGFGRRVYAKLPSSVQMRMNDYVVQGNTDALQCSAEQIVHAGRSRSIGPKLLPLLVETNQLTRAAVLGALLHHIGPDNVKGVSLRPLSIAAHDDFSLIRARMALCLADIGPSAKDELHTIRELCMDKDVNVRLAATWALSQINDEHNAAPQLGAALLDYSYQAGEPLMGWEVYRVSSDLRTDFLLRTVIESCLTNSDAVVRGNACLALIHDPKAARKDMPALTKLLDDADADVRKRAGSAIKSITNSGPD